LIFLNALKLSDFHSFKQYAYIIMTSFVWRDRPLVGQGLLIVKTSRSHSDMPHSVGPLWASDQLGAETSI